MPFFRLFLAISQQILISYISSQHHSFQYVAAFPASFKGGHTLPKSTATSHIFPWHPESEPTPGAVVLS
jgi:hypothetical protein